MGHQHQIASFVPVVMESVVIDVAKHSTWFQPVRIVDVNVTAQTIHHLKARFFFIG